MNSSADSQLTGSERRGDLLIQHASVIDGTDAPVRNDVSILIRDGVIHEIAEGLQADGVSELDVKGAYAIPGLIDTHVHLMWGPGVSLHHKEAPTEQNWKQTWGSYFPHYLKAYLACGVTTILDVAAFPFVVHEIRRHLAAGNPGPRYLTLGPMLAPPKGYGDAMAHTVSTPQEVEERLDLLQTLEPLGVKTSIEKGWCPWGEYAKHSDEVLDAIKAGADMRGLPIYVHATSEEELRRALTLGVHTLAHTLIHRDKEKLSDDFVTLMKQTGTYQMSTLATMDLDLMPYHLERLDDPLLQLVVPEIELATAKDPLKRRLASVMFINYLRAQPPTLEGGLVRFLLDYPTLSTLLLGGLVKLLNTRGVRERSLENSKEGLLRLHKGGVPVVMGSDSVYAPFAMFAFHGFSSIREVELLGEAGLKPREALRAATITAAKMVGFDRQLGTIQVGKRADLAVLRDNPLDDLRALRSIQWTIKDGVAHTPKEWMSQ
jgi:imidazolonepropionase-like amidohydrolase